MFSNIWKVEDGLVWKFKRKGISLLHEVLVIWVQLDLLHELVEEALFIKLCSHLNVLLVEFLVFLSLPFPTLQPLFFLFFQVPVLFLAFLLAAISVVFIYELENSVVSRETSRKATFKVSVIDHILEFQENDGKRNYRVPLFLQKIALDLLAQLIHKLQLLLLREVKLNSGSFERVLLVEVEFESISFWVTGVFWRATLRVLFDVSCQALFSLASILWVRGFSRRDVSVEIIIRLETLLEICYVLL